MSAQTELLLTAAIEDLNHGRVKEAEERVRLVLSDEPSNLRGHLILGVLAARTNRPDLAYHHLNLVIETEPDTVEALFWLSNLHRRSGNMEQAVHLAERAAVLQPNDPFVIRNLGFCYVDALRRDEAIECFQRSIELRKDPMTYHTLGSALFAQGRDLEAAKAFDEAIALRPDRVESWLSLCQVLINLNAVQRAEACAARALELDPASVEGHLMMAAALSEQNKATESEKHLQQAIALNPQSGKAHGLLGLSFQAAGRFEEANAHLLKSLELEPVQGFGYFALTHNSKSSENDRPLVQKMEEVAAANLLPDREVLFLRYGLGKAYERLGEYEKAIRNYDEAARLSKKLTLGDEPFDRDAYARSFDRMMAAFSEERIRELSQRGDPSDLPIVIVGMMRSGTTLCEQILSSHPRVGPAGEQSFWSEKWNVILADPEGFDPSRFASGYLRRLTEVAPGFPRVTDKNPSNYESLGPIHCAIPNARIIHMRRNPIDTCLSIYVTPNRVRVPYAHDRGNIVFAYRQYERIMGHWRAVLPPDRLLEVVYEDLVADQEGQVRRMLEFLGLEWDEAVLHHERNDRTVLTPSNWQVRQPIYQGSVERWRHFEPWLGEFGELVPGVVSDRAPRGPGAREALDLAPGRDFSALKEAADAAVREVRLRPNDPYAHNELGLCLMELRAMPEAVRAFESAVRLAPDSIEILCNLGQALYMSGLYDKAAEAFRSAIARNEAAAGAHVGLARSLFGQGQLQAAIRSAERAIEIDSELASARTLLAHLLIRDGRPDAARASAEEAVRLDPNDAVAHTVLAQAFQSQGRTQEWEASLRRALELDPRQANSYFALLYGRKVTEADRALEPKMLALLKDRFLAQTEIEALHYGLGRLYENFGEYDKSIRHYDEANRIGRLVKFRDRPFDPAQHAAIRDRAISFFTKDRFGELRGGGHESDAPIFIVGMMRSGTTLMEQILSCHPEVGAAGEQGFWVERGADAYDPSTGSLDKRKLRDLADAYLQLLRARGLTQARITDKMPMNVLALGFIHAALPKARILRVNRDPADTCFSIYATPNETRVDFLHDKNAIAFAYRTYERLVGHWRAVLPPDRYMEVDYESLIDDQEAVTRRVLEFCGLEWSDRCLSPERNERSVATPSVWQVRQPIYKSSVQRWKHFEAWLPEFAGLESGENLARH